MDIAALLIKYNTCVNATDKWAFTPLHEAAQKGRTQLCALLLAHGADPTMKNQEGQTALDLATVWLSVGEREVMCGTGGAYYFVEITEMCFSRLTTSEHS